MGIHTPWRERIVRETDGLRGSWQGEWEIEIILVTQEMAE
jgi:hypothetical protein